jgi:hypothetical protein
MNNSKADGVNSYAVISLAQTKTGRTGAVSFDWKFLDGEFG